MNLSSDSVRSFRERDGQAADDRPAYVADALTPDIEIGYSTGRPVVSPSNDIDVKLGDDVSHLYDHYPDNIMLPSSGDFLADLFDSDYIGSISDAADELGEPAATVRKAVDLHDIGVSDASPPDPESGLTLPSGETIPFEYLPEEPWRDKAVLWQVLAQDGLSCEESARYFSYVCDDRVTEQEVRAACEDCRILEPPESETAGGYSPQSYPHRQNTTSSHNTDPVDFT